MRLTLASTRSVLLIALLLSLGLLGADTATPTSATAAPFTCAEDDADEEADGFEDEDEDEDDIEHHLHEQEIEHRELEGGLVGLELIHRMKETADDADAMAIFVIMHIEEFFEEEAEGAAFLKDVLADVKSPAVRRVLRYRLAEVYREMDDVAAARNILRMLITDKAGE
ncbi:MAG: hypothetical protein OER86_06400 [Phycisphaerae bacterium]|nr:hypothetical protein [Phycisphaerae bacterium]